MTRRLLGMAHSDLLRFEGWTVAHGIDHEHLNLRRLTAVIYHWVTLNGDSEGIEKFDAQLFRPPKGVEATVGPWSPEAEAAALADFASSMG